MLRIGEFSRLCRVTVKTLHHYDEIGLLKPAHIDQFTDYRYYSLDQLPRIHSIMALKELGLKTPIVTSSHNGLNEAAKAVPITDLEGSYSVFAFAPYNDPTVKVAEIFAKYNKTKGTWGITSAQTAGQALLAVAAIERAAAKVGADKLSGQAVYDALLAGPFPAEQFLGLLPTVALTAAAPFPTEHLAVKAMTVKGGKLVAVSDDWMPVPALAKW